MMKNLITARPNHSCFYCLNKMKMNKVDSLLITGNDNKFLGVLYAEILNGVDYDVINPSKDQTRNSCNGRCHCCCYEN